MDLTIRPEQPSDVDPIGAVVAAAFGEASEARLVELLRASPCFIPELSLVALATDRIVGHVMITTAWVQEGAARWPVANLAPLAVAPDHQRAGVGSALMHAVIAAAQQRGEPMIVLQGNPAYYSRFGFEWSVASGVTMDLPDWAPKEAAQVLRLDAYDPATRGHLVLPPAFDGL